MKSRSRSIVTKLVVLLAIPLVSLVVLWGLAASITIDEGVSLLQITNRSENIGLPGNSLVRELQEERRLSVLRVADAKHRTDAGRIPDQRLTAQRARTDKALRAFRDAAVPGAREDSQRADELSRGVAAVLGRLDSLARHRAAVDRATVTRLEAGDFFTRAIDAFFPIYRTISTFDESELVNRAMTMVDLAEVAEVRSEESALLTGTIIGGRFTAAEFTRFVSLVHLQRHLTDQALPRLAPADRDAFTALSSGSSARSVESIENRILLRGYPGSSPAVNLTQWTSYTDQLGDQFNTFLLEGTDRMRDDFTPVAGWIIARLALGAGLGLLAVVTSIIVSLRVGRSLARELVEIRRAAFALATEQLPDVVRRLRSDEEVDVTAEVRPLSGFTVREVQAVANAMDTARSTAIEIAVEESSLRRGVREVFLNLARRSQALVHRQLTLLDEMERRESDPDELENLYRLDHLATRMRRHAEDLIILSGAAPGRGWRNPVPLVDVIRGAVAEIEDYSRVQVQATSSAALAGRAVSDVIHLLAELLENAASFSPPHTTVHVSGELVPNGFAVEIEDRGLGMDPERLAATNARLADPPEFDLHHSERLGLFVVGQLAKQHGIRVVLRSSPYGGVTAIVLVPSELVVNGGSGADHGAGAAPSADGDVTGDDITGDGSDQDAHPPRSIAPTGPVTGVAAVPAASAEAPDTGRAPDEPLPAEAARFRSRAAENGRAGANTPVEAGADPVVEFLTGVPPHDSAPHDPPPAEPGPDDRDSTDPRTSGAGRPAGLPARSTSRYGPYRPAISLARPVEEPSQVGDSPVAARPEPAGAGTPGGPTGVVEEALSPAAPTPPATAAETAPTAAPEQPAGPGAGGEASSDPVSGWPADVSWPAPAPTSPPAPDPAVGPGRLPTPREPRPRGVAAAPAGSRAQSSTPDSAPSTVGRLPRRVRQASLAAPLRRDLRQEPNHDTALTPTFRPPEEVRAVMSAYQRGSVRGRSEAARTITADQIDPSQGVPHPAPTEERSASENSVGSSRGDGWSGHDGLAGQETGHGPGNPPSDGPGPDHDATDTILESGR